MRTSPPPPVQADLPRRCTVEKEKEQQRKPKTVAVLGARRGLGFHIALEFASHGFRPVLIARRESALKEMAEDLAARGREADYEVADCADFASVRSALARVEERHGPLDVLVYNAAVLAPGSPAELDPEELVKRYRADVAGALCAVQAVLPSMKQRKSGALLFTGGGFGLDPQPEYLSVSLHKAALRALALALRKDLARDGIHVGIVNVKGAIGSDGLYSPARLAGLFHMLYESRDNAEITV